MIEQRAVYPSSPSDLVLRNVLPAVLCAALCALVLGACGPSTEVVKLPDAPAEPSPVSPERVEVYRGLSLVECDYKRIALVEAQESESMDLGGEVSRIELIRAAREEAAKLGANTVIIDSLGARTITETEVEADSATYERTESKKSLGRGFFLAVRENRPCETPSGQQKEAGKSASRAARVWPASSGSGGPVHARGIFRASARIAFRVPEGAPEN